MCRYFGEFNVFSIRIERLISAGIFDKWFNDDHALPSLHNGNIPPRECVKDSVDKEHNFFPINIANVKLFSRMIWLFCVLSILILLSEIIIHRSRYFIIKKR